MGLGRGYKVGATFNTAAAPRSWIFIAGAAAVAIVIRSIHCTADGDETNQQMSISLERVTAVGTLAGTAETEAPDEPGDAAAAGAVQSNAAEGTATFGNILMFQGASSLGGLRYDPFPDDRPVLEPGGVGLSLRLKEALTALDIAITFSWLEIG